MDVIDFDTLLIDSIHWIFYNGFSGLGKAMNWSGDYYEAETGYRNR